MLALRLALTCPTGLLQLSSRLSATASYTASQRIKRAYVAGQWAKATIDRRVSSPNRTSTIELPNRVYAVLRTASLSSPRVYGSSKEFFGAVGDLS